MNFLAHLHLADWSSTSLVGALLGDVKKGRLDNEFPPAWNEGIRIHRRIDAWYDVQPEARNLLRQAAPNLSWRGLGLGLDVMMDHCLIQEWQNVNEEPLKAFVDRCHAELDRAIPELKPPAASFFQRVIRHNLILACRTESNLLGVLKRLENRLRGRVELIAIGKIMIELKPLLTPILMRQLVELKYHLQEQFGPFQTDPESGGSQRLGPDSTGNHSHLSSGG